MGIDAVEFDRIAREVFAPIYPVVAQQILDRTGINVGVCLDIGCGGGYLGLALARISTLEIILFDELQDMIELAQGYINESGLESRMSTLTGDVHSIPLADGSVNLAVSRGSMFFWKDRVQAFREIYRVLTVGGMAVIGGGFGNMDLLREIEGKMMERDPEWQENRKRRIGELSIKDYRYEMEKTGVPSFKIQQDETGLWIIMRRSA